MRTANRIKISDGWQDVRIFESSFFKIGGVLMKPGRSWQLSARIGESRKLAVPLWTLYRRTRAAQR
jgi:hypothetical protein